MPARRPTGLAALLAALLLGPGPGGRALLADAGSGSRPLAVPADNSSHVADDDPLVRQTFAAVEEDARRERWSAAAERLQAVIDRRWEDAETGRPVPHVVGVGGSAVYEGAWIVARHALLRHGEPLRQAYAVLYGGMARSLLEAAALRLDEALLAETARRFLALPEGRMAALLLADAARERGDADAAFAPLEALEDLEEAGDEPEDVRRPWREARLAREALLLARSPDRVPAVREQLARAAAAGARAAVLESRVAWEDRRPREAARTWSTSGGAADRAALPAPLGLALRPVARARIAPEEGAESPADPETDAGIGPSPWLPPRAVVGRDSVFVCDGETLWAFDRATQRERDHLSLARPEGDVDPGDSGRVRPDDGDPHEVLPLLEGHTLTLDEPAQGIARLFVCTSRRLGGDLGGDRLLPESTLAAFWWDGSTLLRRWSVGSSAAPSPLPARLSLYGAPCLYQGRLWLAGVRPSEATSDRLEAWLVAFDPASGVPTRQVRLGTGSPVRSGRLDEAIPSSPAAAHGRVVVSTALGFVAAVDAEDGRVAWILRYSRGLETGRARRMGREQEDVTPRLTGFANEPPVIAFGRTLVAPTDANDLLGLATRPRGPQRDLRCWDPLDRRQVFQQMAAEYVLGAVGGADGVPPQVVVVGKGDAGEGEPPGNVIAGLEPVYGRVIWSSPVATGRAPVATGRGVLTQREAYLPTSRGLLVIDLAAPPEQRRVGLLGEGLFPADEPGPPALWTGNLVPLPGQGLLAVNLTHLAFWLRR